MESGLFNACFFIRRRLRQCHFVIVCIFGKVEIELQGVRPVFLVDFHPVFILDLQEVPVGLVLVNDDNFLIWNSIHL